ncbi:hypothetical protein RB195_003823 [Necator americanus]|uniref:hydroxyisourate hydrolase n=1 Tax=Necator americanus TaxID=51031 RepID=A0ABR1DRL4_NECAM
MSERLCGCHAVTGAGVVTSLQLILLVLTLSSTGMVLARYRVWESYEPRGALNATEIAAAEKEGKTLKTAPGRWSKAILELVMAWYVGFGTYWMFSILILALSFKYYRPVFVIPNFTALVFGCFMNLLAFADDFIFQGTMLGRILDSSKNYQTNDYEEAIMCVIMGLLLLAFVACLFFIIFIFNYHKFLRLRYGHQVPRATYPTIHRIKVNTYKTSTTVIFISRKMSSCSGKFKEMYSLFVFLFFIPSVEMETPTASISSHVLDIALGRPAEGVNIHAYVEENGAWKLVGSTIHRGFEDFRRNLNISWFLVFFAIKCYQFTTIFGFYFSTTTSNGRVPWVTPNVPLIVTNYKLTFMTGDYYKKMNMTTFYPSVEVIFHIANATQHYHVPLTLSPYGYSTYRGS